MISRKKLRKFQSKYAIVIIVATAIIVCVAGVLIWQAYSNRAARPAQHSASSSERESCNGVYDQDVCEFIFTWNSTKLFRMDSAMSDDYKSVYEIDGDKAHIVTSGKMESETTVIGQTLYTKKQGVWYKQESKSVKLDIAARMKSNTLQYEFKKGYAGKPPFAFTGKGKEKCGSLNCFKYEAASEIDKSVKQIIWFDDKEYKPRRVAMQTKDASYESTFTYDKIKIEAPAEYKDLPEGQSIMPDSPVSE